jgi:hypothetical protein
VTHRLPSECSESQRIHFSLRIPTRTRTLFITTALLSSVPTSVYVGMVANLFGGGKRTAVHLKRYDGWSFFVFVSAVALTAAPSLPNHRSHAVRILSVNRGMERSQRAQRLPSLSAVSVALRVVFRSESLSPTARCGLPYQPLGLKLPEVVSATQFLRRSRANSERSRRSEPLGEDCGSARCRCSGRGE